MTHKIKVQMFGNFRMDYNGAPFVAEKMHKESQFNRMMQALIHYSDCGIAKDKLEEIVIGERDIDAPHTALRVIVYKTKQKLAQLGLPGKNLVYLEGGIYYWTPDIEIEEDAAEFEKLYNEACALEKQMLHEPESAETVCDERIKEIEDNMLELYIKALYLYKGEFLAAYTGETWIAQEARRYHIMFEKIINEAAYILRKRKQFKGLEKLGVYAAKVDPFNEWEELIMEAMVETRRYDEAEELYTDVVDYYLRECGIYPSSRLLEILEKYSNQMNHAHEILENIQEGMNEQEETERGGYFCSYPVFRGIYQASIRIMKRTRVPVYLMLCTLEDEEGRQVQSETKMNKYSRQLKKCVGESIRYSDIYLEYEKTGDVEIKLRLFQFYYGSIGDIKQVWEFDEEQLQDVFRIDNESDQGPVFVSILARGTGSLNIISLHDRHSRRGHGFFLPGGERLVSSKGEEVFVYFEKGDMKPPLAVYFSGYRTQEGFEGYYMMRGFGCPFILVTDPRSEGGAFYLGDSEFEQMITDYVTDKLDELGLTKDELVLSGASMGTFGSLYYGSKLSPHALLLAKPLANMGNVARNERILRAGGFATSLDILMKNYDNLSDEAIEQLNNRMWDRFDSADWSQTKFIISYLYEDDYDPDGYPSILSHLKSSGVEVYGKGSHGRHTDNSANVMAWFKSQYNNLLHDDFSR